MILSVYLGIDKWGVVEGRWNFLVLVHTEGGRISFFLSFFFCMYV